MSNPPYPRHDKIMDAALRLAGALSEVPDGTEPSIVLINRARATLRDLSALKSDIDNRYREELAGPRRARDELMTLLYTRSARLTVETIAKDAGVRESHVRRTAGAGGARQRRPRRGRNGKTGLNVSGMSLGDPTKPSVARIYDYFLGGEQWLEVDRETAERALRTTPEFRPMCFANRRFVGRAVRYLSAAGLTQFLDIGSGLPTMANVHKVAHEMNPNARVVYVDNDPVVLPHASELLADVPNAHIILADLRDPAMILENPTTAKVLDFARPLALMLVGVTHHVPDAEVYPAVETLKAALAPGSAVVIQALSTPSSREHLEDTNRAVGPDITTHTRDVADIARFLDGLELVEPGLVPVHEWRPEDDQDPADLELWVHVGVAFKR